MHVVVYEIEDCDVDDHAVLTGRFASLGDDAVGIVEPLEFESLDAALAWAGGVAEHVDVELEDVRYSASGSADLPPLGPDQRARAALGRRRWAGEEWLDRTELDDPIEWLVVAEIHAPDVAGPGPERDAHREVLNAVEAELEEAGFEEVFTSSDAVDDAFAELEEQLQAGATHLTTSGSGAYVIHGTVRAPTWRSASRLATGAAVDALANATDGRVWRDTTYLALYEAGWGATATARPVERDPPRSGPV